MKDNTGISKLQRQFQYPIFRNIGAYVYSSKSAAAPPIAKPSPLAPLLPPVPEDMGVVGGALAKRKAIDSGVALKPMKKEKRNCIRFTLGTAKDCKATCEDSD